MRRVGVEGGGRGSAGVSYSGEHPPSYPTLPWGDAAKGTAVVTAGILPGTAAADRGAGAGYSECVADGDGNFYMTGSTGENIWAYNQGVELWKSPDLKKWEYVGLVVEPGQGRDLGEGVAAAARQAVPGDLGSGTALFARELLHLPEHGADWDLDLEE